MDAAERAAWLRLLLTHDLGPRTARQLLATFGLPQQIFGAGAAALRKVLPAELAAVLHQPPAAAIDAAIASAEKWLAGGDDRSLLTLADPDYPVGLLESTDPPPVLFAWGRRDALALPSLAIVGSRNCTRQGGENAEAFAQSLAGAGLTIVSGLALGIDSAAHRGALRAAEEGAAASTIAVVGTGVDVTYPVEQSCTDGRHSRTRAGDFRVHAAHARRLRTTSRGAIASSPASRAACSWSKQRCVPAA